MIFTQRLKCARTPPTLDDAAIGHFAEVIRAIQQADKRCSDLGRPARARQDSMDPILFVGRPLIPTHLPDGSSYFLEDDLSPAGFGGEHNLDRLDDPTLPRVWELCVESRALAAYLMLTTNKIEDFGYLSFIYELNQSTPKPTVELQISMNADLATTGDFDHLPEYFALTKYKRMKKIPPSPNLEYRSGFEVFKGLPADPDFLRQFATRFAELPGMTPDAQDWRVLTVGEHGPGYSKWRSRLNQVTCDWNQSVFAYRDRQFDPYKRPADWAGEREQRFPLLQRSSNSAAAENHLIIQVDLVHAPEGSFLEFLSHRGAKVIHEYAKHAGEPLTFWDRPLSSRWGPAGDD